MNLFDDDPYADMWAEADRIRQARDLIIAKETGRLHYINDYNEVVLEKGTHEFTKL
jgi:hypothetical protein